MRAPPGCGSSPARQKSEEPYRVVLDLLLIGLGITLEPFPLIAFLLILSAAKGAGKGLAFILGWLACLVVVIAGVVLVTGGKPPQPSTAPSTAALAVKLALGVVLIFFAVRRWRRGHPRQPPGWMARLDRLSPWAAAGLAAFWQARASTCSSDEPANRAHG
jgi:threonine/homoserine/homoserine lactone efflux protein